MQKHRIADLVVGANLQCERGFRRAQPRRVAEALKTGVGAKIASTSDGVFVKSRRVNGVLEK